jgi:ketosteroid isomerase-like protein
VNMAIVPPKREQSTRLGLAARDTSGVELDRRAAMLWRVAAERALSLRFFRDRAAARKAAGLDFA